MRHAFVLPLLIVMTSLPLRAQAPARVVSITIDDLPVVSTQDDLAMRRDVTTRLVGALQRAKVPAVGFVNEVKVFTDGPPVESEVALLQQWAAAGLELGNHSFSHPNLHDTPLEAYLADIARGDRATRPLMTAAGRPFRYFRHPYLATGLTLETKAAVDTFLAARGYTIAPVTFDSADWIFARAYDLMLDSADVARQAMVRAEYLVYLDAKAAYWERQSVHLFGREIPQVLLLHANRLNATVFDEVAAMFRRRGYRFAPLDAVLADEAYRLPDRFTGRAGISWLHRWAIARGKGQVLPDEPRVPPAIMAIAGVTSE